MLVFKTYTITVRHTRSICEGVQYMRANFINLPFLIKKSLMGTESVPHWYFTPSRVMRVCLMTAAHPHGYCIYFIQGTGKTLVSEKNRNSDQKVMLVF